MKHEREYYMSYKYKETKENWRLANLDRINTKRRERRRLVKLHSLQGMRCLNCDILMIERCRGVRIYCESCVKNYPHEVRRHRWRRYYYRKKKNQPLTVVASSKKRYTQPCYKYPKYIVSWKTLKQNKSS